MTEVRTRIHPRGFLNRWLVVGPFPILLASGKAPDPAVRRRARLGALGARTHPLPTDEWGRLDPGLPLPGDEVCFQGVRARWEYHDSGADYTVLLSERFDPAFNSVACLFAQIECEAGAALLNLRAERGAEVWVDGEPRFLVYGDTSKIGALEANARYHINLSPGRHTLLVKCWQCRTVGMNGWALQMQLLDVNGHPFTRADTILSARDEEAACRIARSAEAQRASVPLDVRVGGQVAVRPAGLLDAARVRVRVPSLDLAWEADADPGPVPASMAGSIANGEIDFLDARGALLATVQRSFAVPEDSPCPADPRAAVLEAIVHRAEFHRRHGPAALVALHALGRPPEDAVAWLRPAFDLIDARYDCADFSMLWFLRWRYLFGREAGEAPLAAEVDRRLLNFVYAPEDSDDHTMCMGTENHRALFWTCERLAGQLLPESVFPVTGRTGSWHAARARDHLLEWMGEKQRFGYREWGCHYLMVDLDLLCALRDFCTDAEVAEAADRLACKTLLLLVNDAFRGAQAGARSRVYAPELLWPNLSRSAADIYALLGDPHARPVGDPFSVGMATAVNPFPSWLSSGLNPAESAVIRERHHAGPMAARRTMFRTPHAALASAVCRPGFSGYTQKLDWCASLPGDVKVFTTHPGPGNESREHRPNYWSGSVVQPRVGQWRGALLCFYDIPINDPWGYTHAFWPESRFDETLCADEWFFGRVGDGYVGLRPLPGGERVEAGRYAGREILARGPRTGWVCQVGSGGADGFAAFVRDVRRAAVCLGEAGMAYDSPFEGRLELRPDGVLRVEDREVAWEPDLHIDAPWATSRWGDGEIRPPFGF